MEARVLTPDEITDEEINDLWNQDICMEDWDYIVLAPVDSIYPYISEEEILYATYTPEERGERTEYRTNEYACQQILVGCSFNRWYLGKFRGTEYAIGIAYHA